MEAKYTHYLITRFNVTMTISMGIELDDEWLNHRCDLFERYCVPSIAGQSIKSFTWIIMMNELTPQIWISRVVEAVATKIDNFKILLVSRNCENELREYILNCRGQSEYLITSRLDNDDALHSSFVQLIQAQFNEQPYTFVEFIKGYTYSTLYQELRQRIRKSNPFVTLIETFSNSITTVHCGRHSELNNKGPFIVLDEPGAWVQIIHERNYRNRLKGTFVPSSRKIIRNNFRISEPLRPKNLVRHLFGCIRGFL